MAKTANFVLCILQLKIKLRIKKRNLLIGLCLILGCLKMIE